MEPTTTTTTTTMVTTVQSTAMMEHIVLGRRCGLPPAVCYLPFSLRARLTFMPEEWEQDQREDKKKREKDKRKAQKRQRQSEAEDMAAAMSNLAKQQKV